AFQLISTGAAEDVINIELALLDMRNQPFPSQIGHFHQWKTYLRAGMHQTPAAQSRSHGIDSQQS
ncbi:hypothetical protein PISMIDRAFT_120621, partial [Pisolithus microcarpus 441]